MNITVLIENLYGEDVFYPVCKTSVEFAKAEGTTRLTYSALKKMKELGYSIIVKTA